MRGVAHVDAEHIGAGLEQAADHGAVGRGRAKGSEDFYAAETSNWRDPGAGGRPDAPGAVAPCGLGMPAGPPGPVGPTFPGLPGTACEGCWLAWVNSTVRA